MKIIRVRLDYDLDRILEFLDSERYVNVSVWFRSMLRTDRAEQPGSAAPGVALLPETPLMKAPSFQSWSPYKLEDGSWDSYWISCSIQITRRNRETWIATLVVVLERRADFVLVRDSGIG